MSEVQKIMQGVVTNYQDINGLMKAQFELAQISYQLAEEYSHSRKMSKIKSKALDEKENNEFLKYNMEKSLNTTTAKAIAKNTRDKEEEVEIIKLEATYKGNDVEIRQINKFLSAINQQVSNLKKEREQTNYSNNT